MATRIITAGNATPTIYFMARSTTTGQGLTAKAYGDFTVYYTATKTDGSGEGPTQVSLTGAGTLNAYNSGTCIKVSDTNAPGLYQLCLPSGVTTATYREVRVSIVCTGMIDVSETLIITAADMQTDIRSQVDGSQTAANVEQAAYYTLDIMRMLGTAGTAIGRTATVAANVYTISAGGNLTSEHVGRWCVIVNALGTVSHVRQIATVGSPGVKNFTVTPTSSLTGTLTVYVLNAMTSAEATTAVDASTTGTTVATNLDGKISEIQAGSGASLADIATTIAGQTNVTVKSAVTGSTIEIVKGDAYLAADSARRLTFTKAAGAAWPTTINGSGSSVKLFAERNAQGIDDGVPATDTLNVTGVVTQATGDSQSCYFALTSAQTALAASANGYDFSVVYNDGTNNHTLVIGTMTVLERATV